ncbi:uncharacterized protein LOC133456310 [Cololabis saira]|uniref:uncharacterized protein LOC133456310 n=1 Tax=Cololabis saira TaxID=129043 RepID=UPI002AD35A13|nr:uncharacterized protein LOC133456310 [Cololabis saira]
MAASNDWEIYIPVEAEVKNIPLQSLPHSVLKRMDLPVPDCDSSSSTGDSPRVIWICPAVIGRKSQGAASHHGSKVAENVRSLLGTEFCARLTSLQMSFVSSNRVAWEVLKDISPGRQTHHSRLLPEGSAPPDNQNAVVIYHGRIYLCIRRGMQSRSGPQTFKPGSAVSPRSELTSTNPKKELGSGGKNRVKNASGDVKQHVKKGFALKRKSSSVRAALPAPQSCHTQPKVDTCSVKVARRHQVPDEVAALQPVQSLDEQQDEGYGVRGEYEMQDPGDEEAEGASWNNDSDLNMHGGDADPGSNHSWMSRESLGAATTSTSIQQDFDFSELERDDKIAQLKAKYNKMVSSD